MKYSYIFSCRVRIFAYIRTMKKSKTKKKQTKIPIEQKLWSAADSLRKNIDVAEYKHIVLGLIFLKYISDSFEVLYNKFKEGKGKHKGADPEEVDTRFDIFEKRTY